MKSSERLMGAGLRFLGRVAGSEALDRVGLRNTTQRLVRSGTRNGFRTVGALGRSFRVVKKLTQPARVTRITGDGLFDPRPDEEQRMLADAVRDFSIEQLRPAAAQADVDCAAPQTLLEEASALGIAAMSVPEVLGGAAGNRSAVTNTLVTEALAQGDAGLAVACLAPVAVSTSLALWGNADQQARYLPAFVGEQSPGAVLAVLEPQALFDPFALKTRARRIDKGFVLDGVKSLVPGAGSAELFVVAAELAGEGPRLFIVESGKHVSVAATPAMGLRAAGTGRLELDKLALPAGALLGAGSGDDAAQIYNRCVQLGRIGWCALAVGVGQAVLDYVIPYVNERSAFGEAISQRQAVAFTVSDIAIELESMRLLTRRAASRAEQGLDFNREAALARRLCADKGAMIGSFAVQLLGGHGFVKEHPVERWYRDLRAVGLMEGALLV